VSVRRFSLVALFALLAAVFVAGAQAGGHPSGDSPSPIARGPHISGVVKYRPRAAPSAAASAAASCSTPGSGNYRTDCHSSGRPVNETWVTYGSGSFYAGANDYNSYNGQGQDGFAWSSDGVNWNDAGPIDVFPHNPSNGAGDPGLAVDGNGVVYYSSLLFNFNSCSVGGVELLRRDPATGAWSYYQIAADSQAQFQDKPAIAVDSSHVYESWTQFGSCSGVNVTSPIKVAVVPLGAASVAPTAILSVPGSTYSQGSSIAADGSGGFWITWEEWPSSSAANGAIKLAHWDGSAWNTPQTISPAGFTDLPSPLPGFAFRDNSFPALTVSNGSPAVAWTSYDTGVGRAWLWTQGGSAAIVANSGGSQFFPAIAPDGSGGVYVAYSQVNAGTSTYDQWLSHGGTPAKVSTASSNPSMDAFFAGQFIGDYNGMAVAGGGAHPIWTDIRGPDPSYLGWEMDSMISSPAAQATQSIGFTSAPQTLTAGSPSGTMTVQLSQAAATPVSITLSSSSTGGGFATSAAGPFSPTLSLSTTSAAGFYYEDTKAGNPTLTASATGYTSGSQTETVNAAALASIAVSPTSATVTQGGTQPFSASGADSYGNPVSVAGATWSTTAPGGVSPTSGSSTTFTASSTTTGSGSVTAAVGAVSGSASVTVTGLTAPTNLVASAQGKHIALAWQGSGAGVTYNLYRGTASGSETLYASGLTSISANDMSVTSALTYWYYVKAVGPGGTLSAASNEAHATAR
jgi:hypothetical protein